MKRDIILNILEEKFPKKLAELDDFIGLQIKGKNNIKNILVTLDVTLSVIEQAISREVDLIIAHHPLIYGVEEELIKKDKLLQAKLSLIRKMQINIFIIHTNSDFNDASIAYGQAVALELQDIEQLNANKGVSALLKKNLILSEFLDYIENCLQINAKFRTNIYNNSLKIQKIIIGSGASGDLIYLNQFNDYVFIIGEIKYHHWIYANDNNIKIIEIGHQTEEIFKNILVLFLEERFQNYKLNILKAKEDNAYRTI